MRKLTLWSLGLDVFLTLILVATVSIGYQQSPSELISILHLKDCSLPCWIGITPGKTTLTEAEKQIRNAFSTASVTDLSDRVETNPLLHPFQIIYQGTHAYQWIIRLDLDRNGTPFRTAPAVIQAYSINISADIHNPTPKYPLTVGDLVTWFGSPEWIGLSPGASAAYDSLTLSFPSQHMIVFVDFKPNPCAAVFPAQQIAGMRIFRDPAPDIWIFPPQPWQGFRRCYLFMGG